MLFSPQNDQFNFAHYYAGFVQSYILNLIAGSTPHPRRQQPYTHPYSGRSLRGVSKDMWHPRGPPKGRGKGKVRGDGFGSARKGDSEDREKQDSVVLRGRGRGGRDKVGNILRIFGDREVLDPWYVCSFLLGTCTSHHLFSLPIHNQRARRVL